jgi:hypothetical protein
MKADVADPCPLSTGRSFDKRNFGHEANSSAIVSEKIVLEFRFCCERPFGR